MKCSIKGCPGEYVARRIVHTLRKDGKLLVFENVPAEVCDVCSDTLLSPDTIRRIESLMREQAEPQSHAPVYVLT
jgi:YgiT-type zinc finger domain-containing protein